MSQNGINGVTGREGMEAEVRASPRARGSGTNAIGPTRAPAKP